MKENSITLKLAILAISTLLLSGIAINAVIPYMRDSLNITQAQSDLLGTAPSISIMIFVLLANFIADRIGIKMTVIVGISLAGLSGMVPLVANNYYQILISRIVFGAGIGLFTTFAVTYINLFYTGSTRATLLGIRSSMEGLGQSFMIAMAGLLLNIGWHYSFAVYGLALPIAIFFYLVVPEVDPSFKSGGQDVVKEKMNPIVYLLVLIAITIVMCGAAIAIRFPSIATEIQGEGYNSSFILAIKPILGIIAGLLFGSVNKVLGKKVLYIGILLFSIASFLIGFSNGNFTLLLIGFLMGGFPVAWIFPFLFNRVSEMTSGINQNFATSLIFSGANIGVFIMPVAIQLLENVTGNDSLTVAFPFFGALLLVILFGLMLLDVKGRMTK